MSWLFFFLYLSAFLFFLRRLKLNSYRVISHNILSAIFVLKIFIGISLNLPENDRLEGSLAANVIGLQQGVKIFRVHDVSETNKALFIANKIYLISCSVRDLAFFSSLSFLFLARLRAFSRS